MERVSLVDLLWSTNITDGDFYRLMGIDSNTWVDWCYGESCPDDAQKKRLASVLGVTLETVQAAVNTASSGVFEANAVIWEDRKKFLQKLRTHVDTEKNSSFFVFLLNHLHDVELWVYFTLFFAAGLICGLMFK